MNSFVWGKEEIVENAVGKMSSENFECEIDGWEKRSFEALSSTLRDVN